MVDFPEKKKGMLMNRSMLDISNSHRAMISNKVSVIIPTYGGSDSLLRSVDSVLSQTYPDFEVIIVDDNNPDRHKLVLLQHGTV